MSKVERIPARTPGAFEIEAFLRSRSHYKALLEIDAIILREDLSEDDQATQINDALTRALEEPHYGRPT